MIARTYRAMSSSRSMPDASTKPGRTSRPRCRLASSTDARSASACSRPSSTRASAAARSTSTARIIAPPARPGADGLHHAPQFVELGAGPRQRTMLAQHLVDGGRDAVVDEHGGRDVAGEGGVRRQREPIAVAQQPLDRATGRRRREQQQPPHPAVHHPPLQLRGGDDAQRHAVADVEQRGIRPHAEPVVGRLHDHAAGHRDPTRRSPAAPRSGRHGRSTPGPSRRAWP